MKRIIALLLAAVMMFALCACGTTTVEAYDGGQAAADTAEALDFAAAWATHEPDDIVFYVDGVGVTWQEVFYEVVYYASYLSATEGVTITDWNDVCSLFTDADGNYYTYGAVVLQNAVAILQQYHIVYKTLTDEGIILGKDALDYVDSVRQTAIDDNFDGDEQAFLDYLESMYCTDELWTWFNQVDALYSYDGFDALYGQFGSALPDDEVMTYAAGDEDGDWTEYVQLKQIYLYDTEDTDDAASAEETAGDATEEATADIAAQEASSEVQTIANDILAQLEAADDKDAAFDALYAQYNEEASLDNYPDGWCIYEGDTDDAIYQQALSMEEYDCAVVSIDGAEVVVMKLPIDPDAGVYYDADNDIMYTLRYYAAWQAYSELINGEGGWIASAEADWAGGFEDFSLEAAFSQSAE